MKRINAYFKKSDSSESNPKNAKISDVQTSSTETLIDHSIFDICLYVGIKLTDAEKIFKKKCGIQVRIFHFLLLSIEKNY